VAARVSASRGSAWPTIIGVMVALLLAAAGISAAMRRRRLERS
jgi:hypothetical protein